MGPDAMILVFWILSFKPAFHSPVSVQFSSVQSLSHVLLSVTPWTAARQASLSITNSWSLLKLMPIESVMPFNHLILCHPLLLSPSIFSSIRVFSNESALWPSSRGYLVPLCFLPLGCIICVSEVIDISSGNLDFSLWFIQPRMSHDVLYI